jgi:hypothetical protein
MYASASQLRLPRGMITELADDYGVCTRQISRLWCKARAAIKKGTLCDVESGRKGRSGRKPRLNDESIATIRAALVRIPLDERANIRTLSEKLGIPKSSLHNYFRAGLFRCHTSHMKPKLSEQQRLERIKFALSHLAVPSNCLMTSSLSPTMIVGVSAFAAKRSAATNAAHSIKLFVVAG